MLSRPVSVEGELLWVLSPHDEEVFKEIVVSVQRRHSIVRVIVVLLGSVHYAVGFFIEQVVLVLIVLVEALVLLTVPPRIGLVVLEVRRNAS